jgi:DNA/RNA-binding domain of Phe-tRNA-synthetase-like protein
VEILNRVKDVGVRIAYQEVFGVNNSTRPEGLEEVLRSAEEEARKALSLEALKDHPIIRIYRDFYWRVIGIDPTKQRPAQEALLRRVLRGEPLPRINPAVDIGNAASIRWLVPVGLYDIDKAGGDVLELRWSNGEEFMPIGGKPTRVERQIILARGSLVLHVYPYRDSELTKVDESTKNILIVVAGLRGVSDDVLTGCSSYISSLFERLLGGRAGPIKLA